MQNKIQCARDLRWWRPNCMTELKQKYFAERREFYLESDRIRAITKNADGQVEFFVQYEDLTSRTRHITRQSGWIYISAISFGVFSLVGLAAHLLGESSMMRWVPLWLAATLIFFGFHFALRRKYTLLDLTNGKSLFFLNDRPSKEKLRAFLEEVISTKKNYLRKFYLKIDSENDPQHELSRFQWLLSEGAIDEAEYQDLKMQLKSGETRDDNDEMDDDEPRVN